MDQTWHPSRTKVVGSAVSAQRRFRGTELVCYEESGLVRQPFCELGGGPNVLLFHLRERFALAILARFGGFLSLMAVAAPSLISNSPLHEGHLRREETMTICIDVKTIKDCHDPEIRRDLLLTMRLLLAEADAPTAALDQAVTHLKLVPHRDIDPSPKAN